VYASKRCNDGNLSEKIQCNCLEGKPSAKPKGSECLAPPARQNDYRTFCMSEETVKVCRKLEEVISIC